MLLHIKCVIISLGANDFPPLYTVHNRLTTVKLEPTIRLNKIRNARDLLLPRIRTHALIDLNQEISIRKYKSASFEGVKINSERRRNKNATTQHNGRMLMALVIMMI